MAGITPPPLPNSYPNCATLFLYQLNGLYYYRTIDCATLALGYGVSDIPVQTNGCGAGGVCQSDSVVQPIRNPVFRTVNSLIETAMTNANADDFRRRAIEYIFNLSSDETRKGGHPYKRLKSFRRRLERQMAAFIERHATDGNIDTRRVNIAKNLMTDPDDAAGTNTNLRRIFNLKPELADALLQMISTELATARIGELTATEEIFVAFDRDLEKETISAASLTGGSKPLFKPGVNSTATDAMVNGVPYVSLQVKNQPSTTDITVYFRLQKINSTEFPEQYIGQQIAREDIPVGDIPNIHAGIWSDRHAHFHVLRANSGGMKSFLVYSAEDLSTRELTP